MSVLIKGMEMPTSCWECRFNASTIDHHEACLLTKKNYNWGLMKPPSDCPIVPVPPHGRLIDADAFITQKREQFCNDCDRRKGMKNGKLRFCYEIGGAPCRACYVDDMLDCLDDAPAIIEADKEATND